MPDPVIGHQYPAKVGMPVELYPHQVIHLTLEEYRRLPHSAHAVDGAVSFRHRCSHKEPILLRDREEIVNRHESVFLLPQIVNGSDIGAEVVTKRFLEEAAYLDNTLPVDSDRDIPSELFDFEDCGCKLLFELYYCAIIFSHNRSFPLI